MKGLDDLGLVFKNPSLYGNKQAMTILSNADSLECIVEATQTETAQTEASPAAQLTPAAPPAQSTEAPAPPAARAKAPPAAQAKTPPATHTAYATTTTSPNTTTGSTYQTSLWFRHCCFPERDNTCFCR